MNMDTRSPDDGNGYSEAETVARREAALQQMLSTPPQPRTPSKAKREESNQLK